MRMPTGTQVAAKAHSAEECQFLTESELAARWRVSVKTLRNARVLGTGCPYLKLGCVRYRMSDVLEFERMRMQRSTSERHSHD